MKLQPCSEDKIQTGWRRKVHMVVETLPSSLSVVVLTLDKADAVVLFTLNSIPLILSNPFL